MWSQRTYLHGLVDGGLLNIRKDEGTPGPVGRSSTGVDTDEPGGEDAGGLVVVMKCQSELFEVVSTLRAPGCFTGLLNSGEKQRNQNSDNGDDHKQFNQREPLAKPNGARGDFTSDDISNLFFGRAMSMVFKVRL